MEVEPLEDEIAATGTTILDGKHTVPKGVALEVLDGGAKKLSEQCPAEVQDILVHRDAVSLYKQLVGMIVESGKTRGAFGQWKEKEFENILQQFKESFGEKGIKVALCKRKSANGTYRWLEFVDLEVAPDYVPQCKFGSQETGSTALYHCLVLSYLFLKFRKMT